MEHPIDKALAQMSERDRRIAEELSEAGFDDEDMYAALPTPGAEKLLRQGKRTQDVNGDKNG
ncbi:hypothetical protein [Kerstersia gyiorum]|uniref:hypothetical protein n=1 Tax=Kerstersia gyiorum TaxID=206506 RepID=UPI0020A22BA8|nr:hypothetical protein [Kerstersia gyiorum]MCP1679448.1 uncharacterized protein Smg (DUF494 family) [Kerstersia gyiorum]MCP1823951.1 uncharacterized protein Smg (DUF494 family) [Kerstersia gyiorum]MCP1827392.1 uncharacterized protein Smg (DUF494 family) [Kerstersia gyiorum]MCW2448959.1 uncharacterized protein Smg (DUF494 family) [Kerstersia gyiorum]